MSDSTWQTHFVCEKQSLGTVSKLLKVRFLSRKENNSWINSQIKMEKEAVDA